MNTQYLTITNLIIFVTVLVSYQLMNNRKGKSQLIFHPVTIKEHNQWYRFLTSGFIHADWWHLGVNMFVLWSFGNIIEKYYYPANLGEFSTLKYMALYFGGIIVSSIPSFIRYGNAPHYAALGASGGVSAVLFANIIFEPWNTLMIFPIPVEIPLIVAGIGYLAYSWYMDKKAMDNIGHMAHFTGAIWGFFFTGFMKIELFTEFIEKTISVFFIENKLLRIVFGMYEIKIHHTNHALSFFMINADAQNLSTHQWKNRLILILVNDDTPPELQTQLTEFRIHSAGMKERRLVVYQIQPNQFQRGLSADNEWITSKKLYEKYKSYDSPFEVILIGLDGGIKLTQNDMLTCEKLFAIIDAMPMRRRELKRKG